MAHNQKRFLGDLDAANDHQFKQHFVKSRDLNQILSNQSDIIFGSKGVGKTALRRALTELYHTDFYATKTIDLDNTSFAQIHAYLSKLKDTSQTEVETLARNVWRNVLAMYSLETIAEQLSNGHELRTRIEGLLDQEGFRKANSNERVISQIEKIFERIAAIAFEDDRPSPTPLGLTQLQRSVINQFPSSPLVSTLLEASATIVTESGKVVLICLDGFDSIVSHTSESRKAIFAGLIDAIHKCSKDVLFNKSFCFKAFLPQELTSDARTAVWDADKHLYNTHFLSWNESDFQSFLRKRLLQYARTKSNQFLDVWHQYMPEKIRNKTYGIEEPSFNYILRHTLYRPRQLLAHVQKILDEWDEKSNTFRVDLTFIPPVVARTNYTLAENVVNQLEIAPALTHELT